MSGQAAFNKPVRPAALYRVGATEEEQDEMSDEEGDRVEDEEEFAAPDWRVRAGPRNKPTQREREEHEATHVPFRDRCAHCMMGRGRTHHHIAKQKGEDESRRPIENAIMLLRGIIRTIKCHIESKTQEPLGDESPVVPWLVEHAGCILSRCQKGRDGKTPIERMHGKKPTQGFVPFGEKVLARRVTTEPRNRMNPRYQYGIWLGMRNNSAECFIGNADGVFRARGIWRLEHQDRWDKEAIGSVIGVPWRMTDGQ